MHLVFYQPLCLLAGSVNKTNLLMEEILPIDTYVMSRGTGRGNTHKKLISLRVIIELVPVLPFYFKLLTFMLNPSMASVRMLGFVIPLLGGPKVGSGPIVSKNVEGSGRFFVGIAVEPLTVGRAFEKVTSCALLSCENEVVILCGNRLAADPWLPIRNHIRIKTSLKY